MGAAVVSGGGYWEYDTLDLFSIPTQKITRISSFGDWEANCARKVPFFFFDFSKPLQ